MGAGPQGRRESGMLEDIGKKKRREEKEGGRWVCGRELGSRQSELQQGLAGVQGCWEIQEARGEDVGRRKTTTTTHASYCAAW